MKLIQFLILFLCFFLLISSSEPLEVSILELEKEGIQYHNQQVKIRGYFYQSENGNTILSTENNLPSCCVGSLKKKSTQIVVNGDFQNPENGSLVAMVGELKECSHGHGDDCTKQFYALHGAQLAKQSEGLPMVMLAFLGFLVVCGFFLLRRIVT